MTIEKSTMFIGRYVAQCRVGDRWATGVGNTPTEAMEDCFKMFNWLTNN